MITIEVNNGVQGFDVFYGCDYIGYIAVFGDEYQYSMHTNKRSANLKTSELQTIIDKVNELNNIKPIATIDIKRYAQAIVDSCNKYRYSNDDHYDCEHCDECLTDGRAQHKPDCIVLDAQRVLKEL